MNGQRWTRARAARATGLTSGLLLLAAVVLLVWQSGISSLNLALLVAGLLGSGLWVIVAPGDFQDWLNGRGARYGGFSIISTLLVATALVAVYGVAVGANVAVDMTLSQNFTLSPPVRDVIDVIPRPVLITGFYSGAAQAQRDADDEIYHLFEVESAGLIRVQYRDPTLEPVLAARFGVPYDGAGYVTFIDPETDGPDLNAIEMIDTLDALERSTANAMLRLLAAGQFKVYFTTGHGEPALDDVSPEGLSFIAGGTTSAGLLIDTLDPQTIAQDGIPQDATAVVIPGAQTRFTPEEVAALVEYVDRGGNLLIAADAPLDPEVTYLDADDPLRALLRDRFGFQLHDALVIDPASSFQSDTNAMSANIVEHPVTERLSASEQAVFFNARAITVVPFAGQPESLANAGRAAIVTTSAEAYGETGLAALWASGETARDDADLAGPLALVAAGQDIETRAKLVLVADADFIQNAPVGYLANRFLYTDALAWLTEFFESVEIEPVIDNTRLPVFVTDEQMTTVFVITVFVMPGVALGLGVLVWRRRLRR